MPQLSQNCRFSKKRLPRERHRAETKALQDQDKAKALTIDNGDTYDFSKQALWIYRNHLQSGFQALSMDQQGHFEQCRWALTLAR